MADHPDPTRRLRPLQESRARRRALPGSDWEPSRSGVGTTGAAPAVMSPPELPSLHAGGWVPSFADDSDVGVAHSVAVDGPAERAPWPGPDDGAGDDGPRPGRRHRRSPGSAATRGTGSRTAAAGHRRGHRRDGDAPTGFRAGADADADADAGAYDVEADDGDSDELDDVRRDGPPWAGLVAAGRRPWARWRERWVPDGTGPRLDPGRRGSAVISVVAVAAVLAAALGLVPGRGTVVGPSTVAVVGSADSVAGTPRAVTADGTTPAQPEVPSDGGSPQGDGTPSVGTSTPGSSTPAASGPTAVPTEIVVAVTGGVRQPGVVTLVPGARVADAIAAAGGVVDGTDYTGLNLAAKLADGDSIVVGGAGQGVRSGSGSAAPAGAAPGGSSGAVQASGETGSTTVDLNTADQATLETLPGVGPVMAGNIIAWRTANGGFTRVDDLREITGIGPARYATLAPLVRVG
ncbi:ComEA family DNA-binding protein [Nakamurella deserti]|uniref:ComEA family DNA-binding protein n=1 Tax=Nakamurella deserti TaxID=2164074 RepID=UPI000DBEA83E|nr:ComEA family DNA-binding protein [Nakamurella deserti]